MWLKVVDDEECAAEYSKMYNASDPSIVSQLAEVNQQAHAACSLLTTQVNPAPYPVACSPSAHLVHSPAVAYMCMHTYTCGSIVVLWK